MEIAIEFSEWIYCDRYFYKWKIRSNLGNQDIEIENFANEDITIDIFTNGDCDWI